MIQEGKLTVKENKIHFTFNEQISSYQSQLSLLNQSQHPIYFKIVSTFGKLLSLQNHTHKKIQPNKSLIFNLKLKIPNQIKKDQEILRISYSNKQISSKFKYFDDSFIDIKISFEQNVPQEDEMITQILKDDCDELCRDAEEFLKNGLIKRALDKYEESFLLYRQHGQGLYGMAQCQYLLQNWQQAIDQIETALLIFEEQKFSWLKLKIVFEIYKDEPRNLQMIKSLKKQIQSLTELENNKQKKKEMLSYLTKEEQKLMHQKGGKLLSEFIYKAVNKYDSDPQLKNLYKNVEDYEQEILQVLGLKKPHTMQQSPQFVLDPITYVILSIYRKQIMKDPVIVPSGHSYEPKSLLIYLAKHGNKDLFTRQQLRYEWSRPNNALKKFIQTNPHLKQWMQYENQISTFK